MRVDSIHSDISSNMKKNIVCLLLIAFLCVACSNSDISVSDIPVKTYSEDRTTIDIYRAIENATEEVIRILPGARLGFFSFTGSCKTLSEF